MRDDETRAVEQDDDTREHADDATGTVMGLLAEHIPLTLLADLAVAEPRSDVILASEGLPADAWWEGDGGGGAPGRAGTGEVAGPGAPASADALDALPADPDAATGPDWT